MCPVTPPRSRAAGLAAGLVLAACVSAGMSASASVAGTTCTLAGNWAQTTQDVGSTTWAIQANGDAQESGIGNASGHATLSNDVLTIDWTTSDGYAGVYRWTLAADCTGTGTLTFTKVGPGDDRAGKSYPSSVKGPPPPEPTPTFTPKPPVVKPSCSAAASRRRSTIWARAAAVNEVRVVAVRPGVDVHKAGTPEDCWVPLDKDAVLQQGDEISVDPDGSATLQFADESTFVVKHTSQLKIASFFTEGGVTRTEILLRMGRVRANVRKATEEDLAPILTIRSGKDHTGSVRGTIFDVEYDPGAKRTRYAVIEGAVAVANGARTVLVSAGKEVLLTGSKTSRVGKIGKVGLRGGVSPGAALAKVMKRVARANGPCAITLPRTGAYSVKPAPRKSWSVAVKVIGARKGTTRWIVTGKRVKARGALARAVARRCR